MHEGRRRAGKVREGVAGDESEREGVTCVNEDAKRARKGGGWINSTIFVISRSDFQFRPRSDCFLFFFPFKPQLEASLRV